MRSNYVWLILVLSAYLPLGAQGHLLPPQTNGTFISATTYTLDDSRIWGIDIMGSNKGLIDAGLEGIVGLSAPEGIVGDLDVNQIWTLQPYLNVRPINTRLLMVEAMGHFQYSWIDRDEILVEGQEPGLTKYAWMAGGMLRTRINLAKRLSILPGIGGGYRSDRHESFYTSTVTDDQGTRQIAFENRSESDTFYRGELSVALRSKRGEILGITPFYERRIDADQNFFGLKISIGTAVWEDLPVLVAAGSDPITSGTPVVAQERAPEPPPAAKTAEEIAFEEFLSGIKIMSIKASPRIMKECDENPGGVVCTKLELLARQVGAGRFLSYVDGLQAPKRSDETVCDKGTMNVALGFITENTGAVEVDFEDCRGTIHPFRKRAVYADSTAMWNTVFEEFERFIPAEPDYDETRRKEIVRLPIHQYSSREKVDLKLASISTSRDSLSGIYRLESGASVAILPSNIDGEFDIVYLSGSRTVLDWSVGEIMASFRRTEQFNRYAVDLRSEAKKEMKDLRGRQTGGGDFQIRTGPDTIETLTRL